MKKYLRLLTVGAMLTGRSECVDYKPKKVKSMSADEMREIVDVMLHNHRFLMVMFQQAVTAAARVFLGRQGCRALLIARRMRSRPGGNPH